MNRFGMRGLWFFKLNQDVQILRHTRDLFSCCLDCLHRAVYANEEFVITQSFLAPNQASNTASATKLPKSPEKFVRNTGDPVRRAMTSACFLCSTVSFATRNRRANSLKSSICCCVNSRASESVPLRRGSFHHNGVSPTLHSLNQMVVRNKPYPILIVPALKTRPALDQRFMDHFKQLSLNARISYGNQPGIFSR